MAFMNCQEGKEDTCKPKSMTKSSKYNSLYISLREGLQHSCIEWIKPPLLTSMTIEVSSVLQCVGISAGALVINKGGAHESKVRVSNRRIPM